jgi:hypothetical protein
MKITDFVRSPEADRERLSIVSKTLFWAWASNEEVLKCVCVSVLPRVALVMSTYRLIEEEQVNFGLICSHECAGDGNSLPLSPLLVSLMIISDKSSKLDIPHRQTIRGVFA